MCRKKYLFLNCLVAALAITGGSIEGRAQERLETQPIQSHDSNAVIERKMNHITPEQRAAAAANAKAAYFAAHPDAAAKAAEARLAADRLAKARIDALGETKDPSVKARIAAARAVITQEANNESKARIAAAHAAKEQGGNNE
ncbi:MAG: hypothetical protein PHS37_04770 [Candidatus Omnitrophica bacterium]|nr:hypothetical protein [Candidatus Omnitrophota bacterium]